MYLVDIRYRISKSGIDDIVVSAKARLHANGVRRNRRKTEQQRYEREDEPETGDQAKNQPCRLHFGMWRCDYLSHLAQFCLKRAIARKLFLSMSNGFPKRQALIRPPKIPGRFLDEPADAFENWDMNMKNTILSLIIGLGTLSSMAASETQQQPEVGKAAPDFSLTTGDGSQVSLKDYRGKWVVLYFYPKDFTSGCTKECLNFKLLADPDAKVSTEYGSIMDYKGSKLAARNTFVINPKGEIAKVYTGVKPAEHSEQVLKDLAELKKS